MYAISGYDNDLVIRLMVRVNQQHDGSISSDCVGQKLAFWGSALAGHHRDTYGWVVKCSEIGKKEKVINKRS